MSGIFGGDSTTVINSTPATPVNNSIIPNAYNIRAGDSTLNGTIRDQGAANLQIGFSPTAEQNRADSVNRFRSLAADSQANIGLLNDNANGIFASRLNPVLENLAASRGQLQRGNDRRGLSGSSIANNAISAFDDNANRQIADQQAAALQDFVNANTQQLQFQQNQAANINTVAQQTLAQDLAGLGLNVNAANVLIGANAPVFAPTGQQTQSTSQGGLNLGGIGGLLQGIGSFT